MNWNPIFTGRFHAYFSAVKRRKPATETIQIGIQGAEGILKVLSCHCLFIGDSNRCDNDILVHIHTTADEANNFQSHKEPLFLRDWALNTVRRLNPTVTDFNDKRTDSKVYSFVLVRKAATYKNAASDDPLVAPCSKQSLLSIQRVADQRARKDIHEAFVTALVAVMEKKMYITVRYNNCLISNLVPLGQVLLNYY